MAQGTPQSATGGPELSPAVAIELLKGQKVKGMELVQKPRFDEASIDAWRNQTTHILQQALGEQSYGYYAGAFWNWQTHAITSDDEDEIEQERLADVMRAFPIAMDSLTAAIETLEKLASVKARESSSAQAAEFQAVELLDDQKELLVELVRAEHSVPKERRHKFVVSETMNNPPTVIHEGLPGGLTTTIGDIESLADARMLRTGESSRGGLNFNITPRGFNYVQWFREQVGEPSMRISDDVRRYIGSDAFKEQYESAYRKWTQAEAALWGEDSASQLTTIGHLCRETIQEFADVLVEKHKPQGASSDKAKTVDRVRSVLKQYETNLGRRVKEFLEALLQYWGALSDLIQRQTHGATKEGEPLTWEDAQRVVFQTAVVMWEVDRSLTRMK